MYYLFFEVWALLLLAFILGWLTHWLVSRSASPLADTDSGKQTLAAPASAAAAIIPESWKPNALTEQPQEVDDLKRIKGIGAVIEEKLHEIGVYQFRQVAQWNNNNIAWVENLIAFPGHIMREDWPGQAATLESGETTPFAARVDKGDLHYD